MARLNFFVACPYQLFPLDDYKRVFAEISRQYDVTFRFADEQITNNHVLEKVTNYIRDNEISLFDITGWNPNVTLELGIAVGLGKKYFILLNTKMDAAKDAPSDIKGLDRVQYTSNSELEAKLIFLVKQELPNFKARSDSAFDSMKTRVIETLETEQGQNIGNLSTNVGEDKALVQSVVRAMVAANELKTKGQKKGMIYYTPKFDLRKAPR